MTVDSTPSGTPPNWQGTRAEGPSPKSPSSQSHETGSKPFKKKPLQQHSNKEGCEAGVPLAPQKPNWVESSLPDSGKQRTRAPGSSERRPPQACACSHLAGALTHAFPAERRRGADIPARVPWPERAELARSPNHPKASSNLPEASCFAGSGGWSGRS